MAGGLEVGSRGYPWNQSHQWKVAPPVDRDVLQHFGVHRLGTLAAFGLQLEGVGVYFHGLIHAPDLQCQVAQREPFIAVEHDVRFAELLKTRGLDGDAVRPRGHLWKDESTPN